MNTLPTRTFLFDLVLFGDALPMTCGITSDGEAFDVAFRDNTLPASMLRACIRVRRHDKDNKPRIHDARMVTSKADHESGTFTYTVEFSEVHIPLEELAYAAAHECYQQNLNKINAHDPEVIRNALKAIYASRP